MIEQAKTVAQLLKTLANENRLLILCHLMDKPMTVSEIGELIPNISQPALSQHLAILKAQGILQSSKNRQSVTYSISDSRVEEVINLIQKYYCNVDSEQ